MTKLHSHRLHIFLGIVLGAAALAMVGFLVANPSLFKGELIFMEEGQFEEVKYVDITPSSVRAGSDIEIAIKGQDENVRIANRAYILYTYENNHPNLIVESLDKGEKSNWLKKSNARLNLNLEKLKVKANTGMKVFIHTCKIDDKNFCGDKEWRMKEIIVSD